MKIDLIVKKENASEFFVCVLSVCVTEKKNKASTKNCLAGGGWGLVGEEFFVVCPLSPFP